jgi:hypothetical protein
MVPRPPNHGWRRAVRTLDAEKCAIRVEALEQSVRALVVPGQNSPGLQNTEGRTNLGGPVPVWVAG